MLVLLRTELLYYWMEYHLPMQ